MQHITPKFKNITPKRKNHPIKLIKGWFHSQKKNYFT